MSVSQVVLNRTSCQTLWPTSRGISA